MKHLRFGNYLITGPGGPPASPTTATVGAIDKEEEEGGKKKPKEDAAGDWGGDGQDADKGGKAASYESPGNGGSDGLVGGPGAKGGKASCCDGCDARKGGKGGKCGRCPGDAQAASYESPGTKEPGPALTMSAAPVDIGGDGDDDSAPLTEAHVRAEAGKNGIADPDAVEKLAVAVASDPSIGHRQIHAAYDMAKSLAAGGGMTMGEAAQKALAYTSTDALRGVSERDPEAARVLAKLPAQMSAGYWSEVVLAAGRPRTRLAVWAEMDAALTARQRWVVGVS
jgi:hypothetical protein